MLIERLNQELDQIKRVLCATSCLLYLSDPHWPLDFQLVGISGVRFKEPMNGFVYTDEARRVIVDGSEELFVNHSTEEEPLQNSSFALSEVRKEIRHLFGDFRERESVRAYARMIKTNNRGQPQAVFFVNYTNNTEFDNQTKFSIRRSFEQLVSDLDPIRSEVNLIDAVWRAEATRIVSPSQTVSSLNFYTLEEPDRYFDAVIEAALKALDVTPGTGLGVIHLYDPELETLQLRGSFGPIQKRGSAQKHLVRNGEGVVSWAALTRRSLVIPDLEKSEFRLIHVWLNEDTKSELVVPLEAGGQFIGTMCLECTEVDKFKPHHARSVWYAANKAALAYQLHQLGSMNRKLLNLCWQATAVKGGAHISLDDVATLAKDYLKASSCDISRYNPYVEAFDKGGASYAPFIPQVRPDGWTDFIRRSKQPIWISDIKGPSQYRVHHWQEHQWREGDQPENAPKEVNQTTVTDGIRGALGIPVTIHDDCIGVAWIRYKRERLECPKPALMSLALGFAAEAGLVLDSIERREVDLKEKRSIDSVAEQVTNAIQDRWQLSAFPTLETHVISHPLHSKLGGDYYAGKIIDDKTAGILLVDGQGHGVGGSLHMLPLMTSFESVYQSYSTAHVISQLAKTAETLGVRGSAIYCIFSWIEGRRWLSVTSAGHESLILFKRGARDKWSIDYFPSSQAPMLGHPLKEPLMDHRLQLSAGDVIVGYTDGVAEQHQPFDATHVATCVANLLGDKHPDQARTIAEAIMHESKQKHAHSFEDDATVFVAIVK